MKRREFSRAIKAAIIKRSMNERGQPCCEKCGLVLKPGQMEIDHVVAEALVIDKAKDLTAEDGQLLGLCCHRGEDGKTAQDVGDIARAKRREQKHMGLKRPSAFRSKWKRKISGETVLR